MSESKEKPVGTGRSRGRSPNYPAVGLEDAVKRMEMLYKAGGRPGSPPEVAAKQIGFSGLHGTAQTVLSALKKFGFVEDQNGRLVPTKLAIDVLNFPAGHQRRLVALREAALRPAIYNTIVDQWRELGELPADDSLRPELIADRGFTEGSVDGFLRDFRASLTYAGLLDENRLKLSRGDEDSTTPESSPDTGGDTVEPEQARKEKPRVPGAATRPAASNNPDQPNESWTGPCVRFDLPRGNVIEIRLRNKVTPNEFKKIKRIFDLSEVAFVEDEGEDEEERGQNPDAANE
jgi:hypothetical protein